MEIYNEKVRAFDWETKHSAAQHNTSTAQTQQTDTYTHTHAHAHAHTHRSIAASAGSRSAWRRWLPQITPRARTQNPRAIRRGALCCMCFCVRVCVCACVRVRVCKKDATSSWLLTAQNQLMTPFPQPCLSLRLSMCACVCVCVCVCRG